MASNLGVDRTALRASSGGSTARERPMDDHVYKVVELVGSSPDSIEDAIRTAVERAGRTLRNIRWFEVAQTRGHVEDGAVRHFQVVLKVGFTLEGGE
jgi:flavin-binding protein dodecin